MRTACPTAHFVFAGLEVYSAVDESGGRMVAVLGAGGVVSSTDVYLGTFTFRTSADARGTCTVAVRMADSHLRDSNRGAIGYNRDDTMITIQAP